MTPDNTDNNQGYKLRVGDRRKRDRRRMVVYVSVERRKPNQDRRSGIDRRSLAAKAYRKGQYAEESRLHADDSELANRRAIFRLIELYELGANKMEEAIAGLTREEALSKPGPGKWSIQEIVIHLTDTDAIAVNRMKQVIAEDSPRFGRINQDAYTARLQADSQSLEDAVTLFALNRRQFSRVLRELKEGEFQRTGTYAGETIPLTLMDFIKNSSDHLQDHLVRMMAIRKRYAANFKGYRVL